MKTQTTKTKYSKRGRPTIEDKKAIVEAKMITEYGGEWLVLTDSEADDMAKQAILSSVWAFRPSFLAVHSCLSEKSIQAIQEQLYEDANDELIGTISDIENFVDDAIACDGRGHFIAQYDHEEREEGGFYVYRV